MTRRSRMGLAGAMTRSVRSGGLPYLIIGFACGEGVRTPKPPETIPERFFEQFKREYGQDADRTAWIGYFASKRIIRTTQNGARLPNEIRTSLLAPPSP